METAGEGRAELLGIRLSRAWGPGAPVSAVSHRSPRLMTAQLPRLRAKPETLNFK